MGNAKNGRGAYLGPKAAPNCTPPSGCFWHLPLGVTLEILLLDTILKIFKNPSIMNLMTGARKQLLISLNRYWSPHLISNCIWRLWSRFKALRSDFKGLGTVCSCRRLPTLLMYPVWPQQRPCLTKIRRLRTLLRRLSTLQGLCLGQTGSLLGSNRVPH